MGSFGSLVEIEGQFSLGAGLRNGQYCTRRFCYFPTVTLMACWRISAVLLLQLGPARVEFIQCVLGRVQRGLRAYQPRSVHRVGWIF